MVAWLPGHESGLPPVKDTSDHRKMKLHIHGFHAQHLDHVTPSTVTHPDENKQVELFVFRASPTCPGKKGRWVPATERDYVAFNMHADDEAVAAAMGLNPAACFDNPDNWGARGEKCQHGYCLFIKVHVWAPREMFAKRLENM